MDYLPTGKSGIAGEFYGGRIRTASQNLNCSHAHKALIIGKLTAIGLPKASSCLTLAILGLYGIFMKEPLLC